MRITVIDVEHDDAAAAVAAINAALGRTNGTAPGAELLAIEAPKKKKPKPAAVEKVDLSEALSQTWNWLVANDVRGGHSAIEVAEALGIKPATANYRLTALITNGLAHRVSRGFFRAGE